MARMNSREVTPLAGVSPSHRPTRSRVMVPPSMVSMVACSSLFPDDEGITWYGAAAQWNADGIRHSNHYNNILFGVHSPEGSGWYINGGMTNLYMTRNGAGTKDTRTLRFKKSAVEYVYGPDADRPMR